MRKSEFAEAVASVQEDRSKAHHLLELVSAVGDATFAAGKRMRAVHALCKALLHVIGRGDFDGQDSDGDEARKPPSKYSTWLSQVFDEAWQKLIEAAGSLPAEKRLRELALVTLMRLLAARSGAKSFKTSEETRRFKSVLCKLCSADNDATVLVQRFREYMEYADVKCKVIALLSKIVAAARVNPVRNTGSFRRNAMRILETLDFGGGPSPTETLLLSREDDDDAEATKRSFGVLWLGFLKLLVAAKDVAVYKRALLILEDRVMPHLPNPLLLTDFLMESYEVGGAVSLLALNGVFRLVHRHNLDYPDFYRKLYALLTPDVAHHDARRRARFFRLADVFLTSTHLPEYLVAAFARRLMRVAMTAPAEALPMIARFVGNLLIRHPGLKKKMLEVDDDDDPYDDEEPDPSLSRAAESGMLREAASLRRHLLPQVSQAAAGLASKPLPQTEWSVATEAETTFEDMMETESRKKVFVNVPLTFERPRGLFGDGLTERLFE